VDWSSVMTKLFLPHKLAKHAVGLSFPFGIERMVRDKMVSSNFIGTWSGCGP